MPRSRRTPDRLFLVLGDQLAIDGGALSDLDPKRDMIWMGEVRGEATHVRSHKSRIVMFLAGMRHFRDELRSRGLSVDYRSLEEHSFARLETLLREDLKRLQPSKVVMTRAGEYRVQQSLKDCVRDAGIDLEVREDDHFVCGLDEFERWASARKQLRLEHFYRHMRKRTGVLMDGGEPSGGRWNFDAENRKSFGRYGPPAIPAPMRFEPDATTREVIELVERRFGDHPGSTDAFDWPVTREQARAALEDFIEHRLDRFGDYQDAMWRGEPWLFHARLSAALNLKLLNPREVICAAEAALAERRAGLASVEGFVRQILGWREYVRGLYWRFMPEYAVGNALAADAPLPDFYWTADTDMACLHEAIEQTLRYGYAHHIQRLMVTGLFALLLGVEPRQVHAWYLAVYVDAVEWVELPNTIGMSQYADGGIMASKPYVASGRYIQRMSNYCKGCRYNPAEATGDNACPITTLYWDFLMRHENRFAQHPRTALQWRNLKRLDSTQRRRIRAHADRFREKLRTDVRSTSQRRSG